MKLLLVLLIVGCAVALPAKSYYRRYAQSARLQANFVRPRRAPLQRTMLISGYYRPVYAQRRQGFEPESAMAAFATGDAVAAGSYLGGPIPNCVTCDQQVQQQDSAEYGPAPQLDQSQLEVERPSDFPQGELIPVGPVSDEVADTGLDVPVQPAPVAPPKRKTNKKLRQPQPQPVAEDDDNEDVGEQQHDNFPARKGQNTYFPIMFSGYPGRAAGNGGSGGGVTAIANAYSTGKGGVATSHATAYGGPAPRSKSRNEQPDDE